jgi:hypothetical protein
MESANISRRRSVALQSLKEIPVVGKNPSGLTFLGLVSPNFKEVYVLPVSRLLIRVSQYEVWSHLDRVIVETVHSANLLAKSLRLAMELLTVSFECQLIKAQELKRLSAEASEAICPQDQATMNPSSDSQYQFRGHMKRISFTVDQAKQIAFQRQKDSKQLPSIVAPVQVSMTTETSDEEQRSVPDSRPPSSPDQQASRQLPGASLQVPQTSLGRDQSATSSASVSFANTPVTSQPSSLESLDQQQPPRMNYYNPFPTLPSPASCPSYLFNGRSISKWLNEIDRLFERHGLTDQAKIKEIPYWTKYESDKDRFVVLLSGTKSWDTTKRYLKKAYLIDDPDQFDRPLDKLQDLENGPVVRTARAIHNYAMEHRVLLNKANNSTDPPPENTVVRNFMTRVDAFRHKEIYHAGGLSYRRRDFVTYDQINGACIEWAAEQATFQAHNRRQQNRHHQDSESDDSEELGKESTALTHKHRSEEHDPFPGPKPKHTATKKQVTILKKEEDKGEKPVTMDELTGMLGDLKIKMVQQLDDRQQKWELKQEQKENNQHLAQPSTANISAVQLTADQPASRSGYGNKSLYQGGSQRPFREVTCYSCGNPGHTSINCIQIKDLEKEGILRYDPDHRAYYTGNHNSEPNVRFLQIPLFVIIEARKDNYPAILAAFRWLLENGLSTKFIRKRARYELIKFHGKVPSDLPQEDEELANEDQRPSVIHTNSVSLCDQDGRPIFANESLATSEVADSTFDSITGQTTVTLCHYAGAVDVHNMKRSREGEPLPKQANPAFTFGEGLSTLPHGQTTEQGAPSDDEPVQDSRAEDDQRKLDACLKDKCEQVINQRVPTTILDWAIQVPKFKDSLVETLDKMVQEALNHKTMTVRLPPMGEVLREEPTSKSGVAKANCVEVDESLELDKLFSINTLIGAPHDMTSYMRPLLYIRVRVGPGGGEDEVAGLIDTGAEATVLRKSYALKNGLITRNTSIKLQTYTAGAKGVTPLVGQIPDAKIWVGRWYCSCPIYVVEDSMSTQNLILGLNFYTLSNMTISREGGYYVVSMILGNVRVQVPVQKLKLEDKSITEADKHYIPDSPKVSNLEQRWVKVPLLD